MSLSEGYKRIETEAVPQCLLCGKRGIERYRALDDALFGAPGSWAFSECISCRLLWLNPAPVAASIGIAYANYYTHRGRRNGRRRQNHNSSIAVDGLRVAHYLLLNSPVFRSSYRAGRYCYLDTLTPGSVLEVGCGDGWRLALLREMGWRVVGQEVDPVAARIATRRHNIPVHVGFLDTAEFEPESYDAVIMSHVIEHVPDPQSLLRVCLKLLKPGGRIVVVTPNSMSFLRGIFGQSWQGLDPPRHYYVFSSEALEQLVVESGFEVSRTHTTAINSLGIARDSFLIHARRLAKDDHAPPRLRTLMRCGLLFVAANVVRVFRTGSGEEAVVIATRAPHEGS